MTINDVVEQAQEYMRGEDLDGWLLYDYRGMNPIVWDTLGPVANVTRPCWVWVPRQGAARLLVSFVDQGRFSHLGLPTTLFVSRDDMVARLGELIAASDRVVMEYTPLGALPRASKVDAGTLELVHGFGLEVVPSADLVQYATQRWSPAQLDSHVEAVGKLGRIVQDAFRFIGDSVRRGSHRAGRGRAHRQAVRGRGPGGRRRDDSRRQRARLRPSLRAHGGVRL